MGPIFNVVLFVLTAAKYGLYRYASSQYDMRTDTSHDIVTILATYIFFPIIIQFLLALSR